VKSSGRMAILKADKSPFRRIIVMAQVCNLKMEDILSYSLAPLPWDLMDCLERLRNTKLL